MDGFVAAHRRGALVRPPRDYAELILVPAVLHTPFAVYDGYPPMIQEKTLDLLMYHLASGMTAGD